MTIDTLQKRITPIIQNRWFFVLLTGLLLFLLIKQLIEAGNIFFSPNDAPLPAQPTNVSTVVNPEIMLQWHLFGKSTQPLLVAGSFNLKLTGIFASTLAQQSVAVFVDSNGKEKLYHPGQTVGGLLIQQILPNAVIFNVGGNLQSLFLPKK